MKFNMNIFAGFLCGAGAILQIILGNIGFFAICAFFSVTNFIIGVYFND